MTYNNYFSNKEFGDGSISEWNEGNFKCLRLHEAQEMINIGKSNPFAMNEDKTAWNYQTWKAGIDILYGEGDSKYDGKEIEEVNKVKNFVESLIKFKPPFKKVITDSIEGRRVNFIVNTENHENIRLAIEGYERLVKKFNDKHGLSTRNANPNRGLFG
jgi:hypothetical protein